MTDEKYKKDEFNKLVKKENQMITKGIASHIFYFSDKYSKPMNCQIDDKWKKQLLRWVRMG